MTKLLPPKNSRIGVVFVLFGVALFFSGCNKKDNPVPAAPAAPTAAPVAQQQVTPVQKQISSVKLAPPPSGNQFDFSGKKDPFKPLVIAKSVSLPNQDDLKKQILAGLPIHSFDVSQFRLIGIVTGAKENQAMVVDPNGKGYVLKVGMTIGKNDGRVTVINAAGVEVVEQFKDDNGRVRKENIKITLPRKQ
jgi:type IV pilus assembly protein PilP